MDAARKTVAEARASDPKLGADHTREHRRGAWKATHRTTLCGVTLLPPIVPWYAALLALIYIVLSVSVIRGRGLHSVNLGSGGVDDMERRIRAHGNFAEYVPLTLLVVLMDEWRGLSPFAVHALCLCLVLGRLSHAWGLARRDRHFGFRVGGMGLTLTTLGLGALAVPLTALL